MIIHILIPHFWIAVEEQRRPVLRERPVVIVGGFLEKTGGHAGVLMSNSLAGEYGVCPGMSLAHVRGLCLEAVVLSPDLPLYAEIWDGVMAILLAYTPLVESLDPGEAVCDVSGCERLFGDPVLLAREITRRIEASAGLPAYAGVGANRLVAKLVAPSEIGQTTNRRGRTPGLPSRTPGLLSMAGSPVGFVEPGQEAAFLAPFPVTALPDLDLRTLLAFQVLGLKYVEHLTRISETALGHRFGQLGLRLARYARGRDDRPVCPSSPAPSLNVSRRCDDDLVEGLEPDQAVSLLVDHLAADLSDALREKHLAGRLVTLAVKVPRSMARAPRDIRVTKGLSRPQDMKMETRDSREDARIAEGIFEVDTAFDSRIHSMLPQPQQPGNVRSFAPTTHSAQRSTHNAQRIIYNTQRPANSEPGTRNLELRSMATGRPINDRRTLGEHAHRLLLRVLETVSAEEISRQPGAELQLEMRHFAPPEQLTLPGLNGRPLEDRVNRLRRQENILAARFGATPFRHLAAVDLDSVLSERSFDWGEGMERPKV